MPASPLGKIKMVAQVVAILALILAHGAVRGASSRSGRPRCGWWCVTALVSGADYFRRFNLFAGRAPTQLRDHRPAPRHPSQGWLTGDDNRTVCGNQQRD